MVPGSLRAQDHARWDRDAPVRYLLVREDEEGTEQLWARCAGAEGLFVDPVPPPREVLTLRDCRPAGRLRDALAEPESGLRSLGDVCVEVSVDERPVGWWDLLDAVVLAQHRQAADPTRYDIVLGAAVGPDEGGSELPAAPRFELFAGPAGGATVGRCRTVDGLYRPRANPTPVPLELIGCEPAEPLLAVLRRPRRRQRDWAELLALDRHGDVMASRTVGLAIGDAHPSVPGGTLIDITLVDGGDDRPVPAVRPVWAAWYQGPPTEPNLWARYDGQGRSAWLNLAARAWRVPASQPDRTGGEHHLDGRFVTDVPGLHCAVGEALLGPGRYFGWGWDALNDCLCGGFGVAPPFTLVWHDSAVARRALADVVGDPEGRLCYFDDVVQLLERCGVTVELR
jgi:hypothetical protein